MTNKVIIEDVLCWMDGGTVTFKLKEEESLFEVEFVQIAFLSKKKLPLPGSLLLNGKDVGIRSELEKKIISQIKSAEFGTKIVESEKDLLKEIIFECLEFVESENYIKIAKKVGRIK